MSLNNGRISPIFHTFQPPVDKQDQAVEKTKWSLTVKMISGIISSLNNTEYSVFRDQKTEHIDVQIVCQFVDQA